MRRSVHVALASVASIAVVASAAQGAEIVPTRSAAEQMVGTWQLASRFVHRENVLESPFDTSPVGLKIMHPDGRFTVIIKRSENRAAASPRKGRAGPRGNGLLADTAYGTYAVDETARTVTFNVEASTFPEWHRREVRLFSFRGDAWNILNPDPKDGEDNYYLEWKRLD